MTDAELQEAAHNDKPDAISANQRANFKLTPFVSENRAESTQRSKGPKANGNASLKVVFSRQPQQTDLRPEGYLDEVSVFVSIFRLDRSFFL